MSPASNLKKNTPNLSPKETQYLLKMRKIAEDPSKQFKFPGQDGGRFEIPLVSLDKRENFVFNVCKRRIVLTCSYQTRTKNTGIILARLDFDQGHRNPDGNRVGCPHLHYHKEGYGTDAWATDEIPFEVEGKSNQEILNSFLDYCNVEKLNIEFNLFS